MVKCVFTQFREIGQIKCSQFLSFFFILVIPLLRSNVSFSIMVRTRQRVAIQRSWPAGGAMWTHNRHVETHDVGRLTTVLEKRPGHLACSAGPMSSNKTHCQKNCVNAVEDCYPFGLAHFQAKVNNPLWHCANFIIVSFAFRLSSHVADTLICIHDFDVYRVHEQYSAKNTGGGGVTCINSFWSNKSELIYSYPFFGIDCLVIHHHPKFSRYRSTIVGNLHAIPFYTQCDILFYFFKFNFILFCLFLSCCWMIT